MYALLCTYNLQIFRRVGTPSLNEDYFTKNVHNKIHIPQYLYVPKECRNALKQNFWGEIFLPSKKWRIFGEIQLEIPQMG